MTAKTAKDFLLGYINPKTISGEYRSQLGGNGKKRLTERRF